VSSIVAEKNVTKNVHILYPRSPEEEGGILFYLCPSFRLSKIFFVAFFSVTVDGRNLIFGTCKINKDFLQLDFI
jgi:hypothetical protein